MTLDDRLLPECAQARVCDLNERDMMRCLILMVVRVVGFLVFERPCPLSLSHKLEIRKKKGTLRIADIRKRRTGTNNRQQPQ